MNSFRFTALCAILTAFSAQVMQASSGTSSSRPRMIGGNPGVYHNDINTQGGIYNGGKIPASTPKAPLSGVLAIQKNDPSILKVAYAEGNAHRGNSTRKDIDLNKTYNFSNSKIAKQLGTNKVMTLKQAADTMKSRKVSKFIANHPDYIAQQPETNNSSGSNYSNNSSGMAVNPDLDYEDGQTADSMETYGVGSEN